MYLYPSVAEPVGSLQLSVSRAPLDVLVHFFGEWKCVFVGCKSGRRIAGSWCVYIPILNTHCYTVDPSYCTSLYFHQEAACQYGIITGIALTLQMNLRVVESYTPQTSVSIYLDPICFISLGICSSAYGSCPHGVR